MSHTSAVVLCISFHERDTFTRRSVAWDRVNAWLVEHEHHPLESKHTVDMFPIVGCGEFNYLNEDDFAAFAMSLDWAFPENVVLTIQPQEGATRVWRPVGGAP